MPRIAYVNGRYVPHAAARACISRTAATQFADGVYEVCEVARGYIVDGDAPSLTGFGRSLSELR